MLSSLLLSKDDSRSLRSNTISLGSEAYLIAGGNTSLLLFFTTINEISPRNIELGSEILNFSRPQSQQEDGTSFLIATIDNKLFNIAVRHTENKIDCVGHIFSEMFIMSHSKQLLYESEEKLAYIHNISDTKIVVLSEFFSIVLTINNNIPNGDIVVYTIANYVPSYRNIGVITSFLSFTNLSVDMPFLLQLLCIPNEIFSDIILFGTDCGHLCYCGLNQVNNNTANKSANIVIFQQFTSPIIHIAVIHIPLLPLVSASNQHLLVIESSGDVTVLGVRTTWDIPFLVSYPLQLSGLADYRHFRPWAGGFLFLTAGMLYYSYIRQATSKEESLLEVADPVLVSPKDMDCISTYELHGDILLVRLICGLVCLFRIPLSAFADGRWTAVTQSESRVAGGDGSRWDRVSSALYSTFSLLLDRPGRLLECDKHTTVESTSHAGQSVAWQLERATEALQSSINEDVGVRSRLLSLDSSILQLSSLVDALIRTSSDSTSKIKDLAVVTELRFDAMLQTLRHLNGSSHCPSGGSTGGYEFTCFVDVTLTAKSRAAALGLHGRALVCQWLAECDRGDLSEAQSMSHPIGFGACDTSHSEAGAGLSLAQTRISFPVTLTRLSGALCYRLVVALRISFLEPETALPLNSDRVRSALCQPCGGDILLVDRTVPMSEILLAVAKAGDGTAAALATEFSTDSSDCGSGDFNMDKRVYSLTVPATASRASDTMKTVTQLLVSARQSTSHRDAMLTPMFQLRQRRGASTPADRSHLSPVPLLLSCDTGPLDSTAVPPGGHGSKAPGDEQLSTMALHSTSRRLLALLAAEVRQENRRQLLSERGEDVGRLVLTDSDYSSLPSALQQLYLELGELTHSLRSLKRQYSSKEATDASRPRLADLWTSQTELSHARQQLWLLYASVRDIVSVSIS